jgi:hypothetical protein
MLQQVEFFRNKPPETWSVEKFEGFLFPGKEVIRMLPDALHHFLRFFDGHGRLSDERERKIDKPPKMPDSPVLLSFFSFGIFSPGFVCFFHVVPLSFSSKPD